jgi:hypothetical protein
MSGGRSKGYASVPEYMPDDKEHRREIARKANSLNQGKFNATLDVTLSSAASTTVTDSRIGATSVFAWMPQTANASTANSSGIYCQSSTMAEGSAVLTHGVSSQTDRSFRLLIIG